jgi:hypothetical protein
VPASILAVFENGGVLILPSNQTSGLSPAFIHQYCMSILTYSQFETQRMSEG